MELGFSDLYRQRSKTSQDAPRLGVKSDSMVSIVRIVSLSRVEEPKSETNKPFVPEQQSLSVFLFSCSCIADVYVKYTTVCLYNPITYRCLTMLSSYESCTFGTRSICHCSGYLNCNFSDKDGFNL